MQLGLQGRVVIVTGGSRGIGAAAALSLAKEGARVAITYRSEAEKAAAVVEKIAAAGGEGFAVPLELASVESIRAAVDRTLSRWGKVDALINNAVQWGNGDGPWNPPPFESVAAADWQLVSRPNLEGAYAAIQAVLPAMRAQKWGRIVNVSSAIAVDGLPGSGPYAAAKAALHGLTRTLSKELGPAGILVNVVMPGATLTERMVERLPAAAREQIEKASPIRRLLTPEEVVPLMTFLCSPLNNAVTGEIIRASGGVT